MSDSLLHGEASGEPPEFTADIERRRSMSDPDAPFELVINDEAVVEQLNAMQRASEFPSPSPAADADGGPGIAVGRAARAAVDSGTVCGMLSLMYVFANGRLLREPLCARHVQMFMELGHPEEEGLLVREFGVLRRISP